MSAKYRGSFSDLGTNGNSLMRADLRIAIVAAMPTQGGRGPQNERPRTCQRAPHLVACLFHLMVTFGIFRRGLAAPVHLYIDAGAISPNYGFTDSAGHVWSGDTSYIGGDTETFGNSIFGAPNGSGFVFQTNRLGSSFQYSFRALQSGAPYAVTLLFCELYFTNPDARLFDVTYNGQQPLPGLSNFSVFQAAGGKDLAYEASFSLMADAVGSLTLSFAALRDNAIVSGLEIRDTASSVNAWLSLGQAPGPAPFSIPMQAPSPAAQQPTVQSAFAPAFPPRPATAAAPVSAPVLAPAPIPVQSVSTALAPAAVPVQAPVPAPAGQVPSSPPGFAALAPAPAPVQHHVPVSQPSPVPAQAPAPFIALPAPNSHEPSQAPVDGPLLAQTPSVVLAAAAAAGNQGPSPAPSLQPNAMQSLSQPPSQAPPQLLSPPTGAPQQLDAGYAVSTLPSLPLGEAPLPAQASVMAAPSPSVLQHTQPGPPPPASPSSPQVLSTAETSQLAATLAAQQEANYARFTKGQVAGLIVGLWLGLLLIVGFLAALLLLGLKGRAVGRRKHTVPILARGG